MAKAAAALRMPAVTGGEGLVGQVGEARTALAPHRTVFVQGEWWNATSEDGHVAAGERVEVMDRDGFRLKVRKWQSGN